MGASAARYRSSQWYSLALKGLGIGPDDEVIVSPRSFIASVSCVVNAGATPVFADVDRETGNLTACSIRRVLSAKTRAVVCVHLAGWPCDMDPIMTLAQQHGFKVIEDCAQAHGACYKGRRVGSLGHVGAWSFCQDKNMTTGGEGGMVTTNDTDMWRLMWSYKDHGKSYESVYHREHAPGFRWHHEMFGTNWRMTEMQAALGRIQLTRMSSWSARRRANASALEMSLEPLSSSTGPIRLPNFKPSSCDQKTVHGYYRFYAFVRPENLAPGWTRDKIVDTIQSLGVPCYQGGCSEIYLEKAFENTAYRPAQRLLVAKELGETSLMLLVHPTLLDSEIKKTSKIVCQVLMEASKNAVFSSSA